MADLKRWFKVWTTILDDPHFQEMSLEQIARWALLGAMLASVGTKGRLRSPVGARRLREVLRFDTVDALLASLNTLPNVLVEEGKNRHGDFTVTMQKWTRYQEDTTQAMRQKASRSKRRGEEKREEEKRKEETRAGAIAPAGARPASPAPTPEFKVNEEIRAALQHAPQLGAVPRLWSVAFWRAEVRANGEVDLATEILKAEAWMTANPHKAPRKNLPRFLHNWLTRANRPEGE